MNILISLFDHSGNWSRDFANDPDWKVYRIDIKNGIDILEWDYWHIPAKHYHLIDRVGILAAMPCTDYALSGARHFKAKDADGRTAKSQLLFKKTMEIITFFKTYWN